MPLKKAAIKSILATVLVVACQTVGAIELLMVSGFQEWEEAFGDRFRLQFALIDANGPVANEDLYLRSNLEALPARKLLTDEEGTAYLDITIPDAGEMKVTAFARKGSSVTFSFKHPSPSMPRSAEITYVIPYPVDFHAGLDSPTYLSETKTIIAKKIDPTEDSSIPRDGTGALNFRNPPAGSIVETESSQYFEVRLTDEGRPVSDWSIEVSTSKGTVNSATVVTDGAGVARFFVKSDIAGEALIFASAGVVSASIDVVFEPPRQTRNRYYVRMSQGAPLTKVDLTIEPEQLGVILKKRLDTSIAQEIAKSSGLSLSSKLSSQIVVFSASEPLSRDTKWTLAREIAEGYRDYVAAAGLMARLNNSSQQLIISEEIITRFHPPGVSSQVVSRSLDSLPFSYEDNPCTPTETDCLILRLDPKSSYDVLEAANEIAELNGVKYAQPNFYWFIDFRSADCPPTEPWCDPRYKWQWHLENGGEMGGLSDADADVREAWKFTQGMRDDEPTLIAVLDNSFFATHPDLKENLWKSNEPFGIRITNDEFSGLMNPSTKDPAHGTKAAGVAAARGGNGKGGTGACPLCQLLLIRFTYTRAASSEDTKNAIDMAWQQGADVISNSWGDNLIDSHIYDAIDRAVENNTVVIFAMSNEKQDNCGKNEDKGDISAHHNVIAVSGITDKDRRIRGNNEGGQGFGDCMDLLAPTRGGQWGIDTTTVDIKTTGFEPAYHDDFGGNSAAAPLVAGIAALIRTVSAGMSPLDVQRALQDTADKVEPDTAHYNTETGFGDPPGENKKSHHGYGRVNAFEAVRLVAPVVATEGNSGNDNMDLFLRDHQWDWGNTEQNSDMKFTNPREKVRRLQSVDIKFDVAPELTSSGEVTLSDFLNLDSEQPKPKKDGRLYIRLRNRGAKRVDDATIKVYWARFKEQLPRFPENFWSKAENEFDSDSEWQPLEFRKIEDLEYSGASIAGCPGRYVPECLPTSDPPSDMAKVFTFDVPARKWNKRKERIAFLAVVESDDDKVLANRIFANQVTQPAGFDPYSPYESVVMDNNVTLWTSPPIESRKCLCLGGALAVLLILLLI